MRIPWGRNGDDRHAVQRGELGRAAVVSDDGAALLEMSGELGESRFAGEVRAVCTDQRSEFSAEWRFLCGAEDGELDGCLTGDEFCSLGPSLQRPALCGAVFTTGKECDDCAGSGR